MTKKTAQSPNPNPVGWCCFEVEPNTQVRMLVLGHPSDVVHTVSQTEANRLILSGAAIKAV